MEIKGNHGKRQSERRAGELYIIYNIKYTIKKTTASRTSRIKNKAKKKEEQNYIFDHAVYNVYV